MIILQLYESFELGLTYGSFNIFSIALSIILFQKGSAEILPDILKYLPKCFQILIILIGWIIPYGIASIPFIVFFHVEKYQWYTPNSNEIQGIEWSNPELIFHYIIYALIVLFLAFLLYVCKDMKRYGCDNVHK